MASNLKPLQTFLLFSTVGNCGSVAWPLLTVSHSFFYPNLFLFPLMFVELFRSVVYFLRLQISNILCSIKNSYLYLSSYLIKALLFSSEYINNERKELQGFHAVHFPIKQIFFKKLYRRLFLNHCFMQFNRLFLMIKVRPQNYQSEFLTSLSFSNSGKMFFEENQFGAFFCTQNLPFAHKINFLTVKYSISTTLYCNTQTLL